MPLSRKAVITGVLNGFFGSAKVGVIQYKIAEISQAVASRDSVSWTAYTVGTIPAATYNFAVSNSTTPSALMPRSHTAATQAWERSSHDLAR
jgi:hypothetical protein